jgi:spore coat protein U-like protein
MTLTTRLLSLLVILLASSLLLPRTAHAADPVVCTASVSPIDFGTVDPSTAGNTDVSGTLTWSCQNNTKTRYNVTVCFNIGNGPSGLDANNNRQIQGPGGSLGFQIYSDPSRTQVWGSVTSSPYSQPVQRDFPIDKKNKPGGTVSDTIPVYGRLMGSQPAVTAGTYTTTISAPDVRISGELNQFGYGSCSTVTNGDAGNFDPIVITANVQPACTVTATDLDFGPITGFLTSNYDGSSTIGVTCVNGTSYSIGLDNGLNYSGSQRRMSGPGGYIGYELYRDSGRSQAWGSTPGPDARTGTGNGSTQNLTVYGRVPPQTTPSAGDYQDTVTVYMTY